MVALLNTRCESISKSDSDKVKDHITNKIIYYIIMNMMLSEKNQNQIRDIARAVQDVCQVSHTKKMNNLINMLDDYIIFFL